MSHIIETVKAQDGFLLNMKILSSKDSKALGSIVYYHGGGFLSGEPDDLPKEYLNILNQSFNIIIADYRLAPEVDLNCIIQDAFEAYDFAHNYYKDLPIYVFGRSAGGYLAFQVAAHKETAGIIDFYGYARIHVPQFLRSHAQYKKLTESITPDLINSMIHSKPITSIPIQERYILYLYARGNGNWFKYLGVEHSTDSKFNLQPNQLKKLPPTFIVHGKHDPDVPSSESNFVEQNIPVTEKVIVQTEEHDFDRTPTSYSESIYEQAVEFLKNIK
ncbi:alpha/beta hydrolase [Mammaliicoccus lentus]|uniref:alpha/beta hydrolase n=2 Tax=Mammaliicoccus lentus TaxID=42858 RepID=UPI001071DB52|nr:alpha/beta hydrolase [Mammaliicoccus lentus]MBF0795656.1 alpha/beta hydrolase [Mammaliicoccus lentus]MBW0763615.1 alpha/beta hydrolase [Mammaliicoccus lentus]MBW0771328.1 alpha/beta hydrolase [Mammaliicoccus lentus]TFV13812.1 alpha/beta hydrolase [Mammaliicoccus lentus]